MTNVAEYHQAVKARLIADPLVVRFELRRERRTMDHGHLRARLALRNGDQLEFSEHVRQVYDRVQVITYSFHWADSSGRLIRRWDNAPHFADLAQAPNHMHDREEDNVLPSKPMTIEEVLDRIATPRATVGC